MHSSGWRRLFLFALLLTIQAAGLLPYANLVHGLSPSFASSINLSNDPAPSGFPVTAAALGRVYVAWLNNTSGIQNVAFRASKNNGTSFGAVVKVSNSPTGDASYLQIASAGSSVYIVWQQNISLTSSDIFFSASTNNGTSFTSPVDLSASVNGLANSVNPQLAAVGNNVYVVWLGTTRQGVTEVLVKGSTSNGSNLGSVTALILSKTPSTTALPQIAATGAYVYAAWADIANIRAQTFFSYSSNSGTTFSVAVSLYNSPIGETDFAQRIAAAGSAVYVTWTADTTFTDNTIFVASTNYGASFGPAVNLYNAQVTDLNPNLAASGPYVYVTWTNKTGSTFQPGKDILYRGSSNYGATFGGLINLSNTPAKISDGQTVVALGSNAYVAWYEEDSSSRFDVYFASSSDGGSTFGNPVDLSPIVGNTLAPSPAVSAAGINVYVTWQDNTQGNGDIFFRASPVADVALIGMSFSRTFAYAGVPANPIIVNVTASNPGLVTASFVVSLKANGSFIGNNQTVTNLAPGASAVVQFSWNTVSLLRGNYSFTAYASQVTPPGETNLSNNILTWGGVFRVKLRGDVTGDCRVNIFDLTSVGGAFGSKPGDPGWNGAADLNNDRIINIFDLSAVGGNFGANC